MSKFWVAMAVYLLLAVMAWQTLSDEKLRLVTLALLAMFAVRTAAYARSTARSRQSDEKRSPM